MSVLSWTVRRCTPHLLWVSMMVSAWCIVIALHWWLFLQDCMGALHTSTWGLSQEARRSPRSTTSEMEFRRRVSQCTHREGLPWISQCVLPNPLQAHLGCHCASSYGFSAFMQWACMSPSILCCAVICTLLSRHCQHWSLELVAFGILQGNDLIFLATLWRGAAVHQSSSVKNNWTPHSLSFPQQGASLLRAKPVPPGIRMLQHAVMLA